MDFAISITTDPVWTWMAGSEITCRINFQVDIVFVFHLSSEMKINGYSSIYWPLIRLNPGYAIRVLLFFFKFYELLSSLTTVYELDGWDRNGLDSGKEADAM